MNEHHKSQEASQEELYEKNVKQIKVSLFKLFNYYNKSIEKIPFFIFYLLSFIEFLQILWYIVHPKLNIYPDTDSIRYLRLGLQFINPQKFQTLKPDYNFIMVGITFVILIIYWLFLYVSYRLIQKDSKLKFAIINIASFMLLLLQTILYIPIFQIISPIFYCTPDSQYFTQTFNCYTVEHIIIIILATLTFVSLLVFKIFCFMLLCQKNPFINTPIISTENNFSTLAILLISLALIWYYIIDTTLKLKFLLMFALLAIFAGYIALLRYHRQGCYNKKYKYFKVCLQILWFGFSLNNIIQYYLQDDNKTGLGLVQLILSMILVFFAVKQYFDYSANQKLRQLFANGIGKLKAQQIIFPLITCLIFQENTKKKQTCAKILIKSSKYSKHISQDSKWSNFIQNKLKPTQKQYSLIVFSFLKCFLQECISQHPSFFLEAILCAVLYELELKSKCVYLVAKLQKKKPNLLDQFLIFQIKQKQIMLKQLNQQQQNENVRNNLIVKYKKYLDLLAQMELCISRSIFCCTEYWNQFLQEEPDFLYLQKASTKILNHNLKVSKLNFEINALSETNIKSKFLYFSYLQVLQWTKTHYQQLQIFNGLSNYLGKSQDMYMQVIKSLDQKKIDIKFQQSQKLIAIEVDFSTNDSIVTNCNSQITNFVGYNKSELMGKKLDKIIPKIYAVNHFKYVEKFIEREDSFQLSSSKIVYALSKQKYLEPGLLTIKILVTVQKGLNIISFIKPLAIQEFTMTIITQENSTKIEGISKLIKSLTNDQQLVKSLSNLECQMEMLFPQINFQKLQQGKLYQTLIATENVQNQSVQISCKKVSLIMERKTHHDLKLKYYNIELIQQKRQKQNPKSTSALKSSRSSRDKSSKQIDNQISLNRSNLQGIQSENMSISRLKQNLFLNFNTKKYFLGSLLLLILIGSLFYLYVSNYEQQKNHLDGISSSTNQANILNDLSNSISNMTIQVQQMMNGSMFQTLTNAQQKQQINIYINSLNLFNMNFNSLVSSLKTETLSGFYSIFSLDIYTNQSSKIKQLYNFQESVIKSVDIQSTALNSQLLYDHSFLFNQLVNSQVLLMSLYFDQQLNQKLLIINQNQTTHENQTLKYTYLKIGLMALLSFGLCLVITKISQNKNRNLIFLCNVNVLDVNLVILKLQEFNRQFFIQSNLQQVFQQTITTLKSNKIINSTSALLSLKKINQKITSKSKFKQSRSFNKLLSIAQDFDSKQSKSNKSLISKNSNENKKPKRISFDQQLNDELSELIFKEAINIANIQTDKSKSFFAKKVQEKQKKQEKQKPDQSSQQILKVRQKRKETFKNKKVQLLYKNYKEKIFILLIIILVFTGVNIILYTVGENMESQEIANQLIVTNLIRLNVKIMHIRSILRIHFTSMTDLNNNLFVNQNNFDNQITILRQYLSEAQPYIGDPVPILRHLYQDVQSITHLQQTLQANSSISSAINDQFLIIEEQLQNHRDELANFINNINTQNVQINSNYLMVLSIEIVILILLTFGIIIFQYFKIVISAQQDEKTTFEMIHMLPISLIKKNQNIKRQLASLSSQGSQ